MCFSNLKKTQFDIQDVRWVHMSGSRILLQAIIKQSDDVQVEDSKLCHNVFEGAHGLGWFHWVIYS